MVIIFENTQLIIIIFFLKEYSELKEVQKWH